MGSGFLPAGTPTPIEAFIADMPIEKWVEVPNSHLQSVGFDWGPTNQNPGASHPNVMRPWCGGAYDFDTDHLLG